MTGLEIINGAIDRALKSIIDERSAVVLRERVTFLKEQIELLQQVASKAQAKVSSLEEKLEKANDELAAYRVAPQFLEHRAALFKRKPTGGYVEAVYCPECKVSTSSGFPEFPFTCHKCGWASGFPGSAMPNLLKELPKN